MAALRSTRLLQFFAPRELGGLEADPVTVVILLEALARIDASTSWTLGILGGSAGLAGAYLPAATTRRLFANGVPPMAGTILPRGTAEPVQGGYRVKGRRPYGSGSITPTGWLQERSFPESRCRPERGSCFCPAIRSLSMITGKWPDSGRPAVQTTASKTSSFRKI